MKWKEFIEYTIKKHVQVEIIKTVREDLGLSGEEVKDYSYFPQPPKKICFIFYTFAPF